MSTPFEFVPQSTVGRRFCADFRVRLGDTFANGILRLDGLARFLQDVATDDWEATGIGNQDIWVVRRTVIRVSDGGRWPEYLEPIQLTTWCGGYGAAWAERRTNVYVEGELRMEAASMWVPIDRSGSVVRMRQSFFDVFGEALQGRKVPGRVDTPDLGEVKLRAPWPLRKSDLDVVGHVNNAALWEAVSQYAPDKPNFVSVIHHASVEAEDDVEVVVGESALWLCVDGDLRVSASFA